MAFLLRRNTSQQQQQYAHTSTSRGDVLYDAGSDGEDDELEAAFGDSDARELDNAADYRREMTGQHAGDGTADSSIRIDEDDGEDAHLLVGGSNQTQPQASGSRGQSPRPRLDHATTTTSSSSNVAAGGYDFEADPYERRSAPVAIDMGDSPSRPSQHRRSGSGQRISLGGNGASTSSNGILATFKNILPARFRQYGLLNTSSSHSVNGRRADGTTDHGDDDDDDDEWIAPPPSMPGVYGGGMSNDGVFANMTAKPGQQSTTRAGRPDVVGGDDALPEKEIPPAYEMAVLDAAPPYFDTTVHAPGLGGGAGSGLPGGGLDEILIEGLPLGNPFAFFWSLLVSMSFQFVGFLLTTLLSTSHAAKNGSRAGLGITLIQYGLFLGNEGQPISDDGGEIATDGQDEWASFWGNGGAADPTPSEDGQRLARRAIVTAARHMVARAANETAGGEWEPPMLLDGGSAVNGVASSWLSMVLMIGGWFLLVSSLVGYLKCIKYAKALRDGFSNGSNSWLERGGFVAVLYTRITGRDWPTSNTERTWGLAPRPVPAGQDAESARGTQSSFRRAPFFTNLQRDSGGVGIRPI